MSPCEGLRPEAAGLMRSQPGSMILQVHVQHVSAHIRANSVRQRLVTHERGITCPWQARRNTHACRACWRSAAPSVAALCASSRMHIMNMQLWCRASVAQQTPFTLSHPT